MKALFYDPLCRAWAWLLLLSLLSTAAALSVSAGLAGPLAGAAILALALLKARLILARYLGLSRTPYWRRGFDWVLGGYMLGLLTLYLIPAA